MDWNPWQGMPRPSGVGSPAHHSPMGMVSALMNPISTGACSSPAKHNVHSDEGHRRPFALAKTEHSVASQHATPIQRAKSAPGDLNQSDKARPSWNPFKRLGVMNLDASDIHAALQRSVEAMQPEVKLSKDAVWATARLKKAVKSGHVVDIRKAVSQARLLGAHETEIRAAQGVEDRLRVAAEENLNAAVKSNAESSFWTLMRKARQAQVDQEALDKAELHFLRRSLSTSSSQVIAFEKRAIVTRIECGTPEWRRELHQPKEKKDFRPPTPIVTHTVFGSNYAPGERERVRGEKSHFLPSPERKINKSKSRKSMANFGQGSGNMSPKVNRRLAMMTHFSQEVTEAPPEVLDAVRKRLRDAVKSGVAEEIRTALQLAHCNGIDREDRQAAEEALEETENLAARKRKTVHMLHRAAQTKDVKALALAMEAAEDAGVNKKAMKAAKSIMIAWEQGEDHKESHGQELHCLVSETLHEENLIQENKKQLMREFRDHLKREFGNIIRAWRIALDSKGKGAVSMDEWDAACDAVSWTHHARRELFEGFDSSERGYVILEDLAPAIVASCKEIRKLLSDKFGGVSAGWSQAFGEAARIGVADFVRGCKKLGYSGNAKRLFHSLDADSMQCLTPGDLQPDVVAEQPVGENNEEDLAEFKMLLAMQFGGIVRGWNLALNPQQKSEISFTDFCRACQADLRQFRGDLGKLFAALDIQRKGSISLQDFAPEAAERISHFRDLLAVMHGSLSKAWMMCFPHTAYSSPRSGQRKVNANAEVDLEQFETGCQTLCDSKGVCMLQYDADLIFSTFDWGSTGALSLAVVESTNVGDRPVSPASPFSPDIISSKDKTSLEREFKNHLERQCSGIVRGWRTVFDPENKGKLTFAMFSKACEKVGWTHNIKTTFKALDANNDGVLTLDEVAPVAVQLIADFRQGLVRKYGDLSSAWVQCFGQSKSRRIPIADFRVVCNEVGIQKSDADLLFKSLDWNNDGHVTYEEFDPDAKRTVEIAGVDSQKTGFGKTETVAKSANKEKKEAELNAQLKDFKNHLTRQFGGIVRAWRQGLDPKGNGRLTFAEWTKACQRIGWSQNLKGLFKFLDADHGGTLSLDELAPNAIKLVIEFRLALAARYGDFITGWSELFKSANHHASLKDLREACNALNVEGDIQLLFNSLDWDRAGYVQNEALSLVLVHLPYFHSEVASNLSPESAQVARSFRSYLTKQYGGMVKAWREALDKIGDGRLDFSQWREACKEIGWTQQIDLLFQALDPSRQGFITMEGLSPDIGKVLADWAKVITKQSSLHIAWRECFPEREDDVDSEDESDERNQMTEEMFDQFCESSSYEGYRQPLFKLLDYDQCGFITLVNVISLCGTKPKPRKSSVFMGTLNPSPRNAAHKKDMSQADSLIEDFTHMMQRQFGNTLVAWYKEFDKSDTNQVSRDEFCRIAKELGWDKEVETLFRVLDTHLCGYLSVNEFARDAMNSVAQLRGLVKDKYGIDHQSWLGCFQPDDTKETINQKEFITACESVGFQGNARRLFHVLDWQKQAKLSIGYLMNLLMVSEKFLQPTHATLVRDFKQHITRLFGGVVQAWHKGLDKNMQLQLLPQEWSRACQEIGWSQSKTLFEVLNISGSGRLTIEELAPARMDDVHLFREILEEKYESVTAGWSALLLDSDPSSGPRLEAFLEACESIRFSGDAKRLFHTLDWENQGYITKKAVQVLVQGQANIEVKEANIEDGAAVPREEKKDPTILLHEFKQHLQRRYGTVVTGWHMGLDPEGKGRLTNAEWVRVCQQMGYTKNLKTLYDLLDADKKGYIGVGDILGEKIMSGFRRLNECLVDRFGSCALGWSNCVNCEGTKGPSVEAFGKACELCGYDGVSDTKLLFHSLDWNNTGCLTVDAFKFLVDRCGVPGKTESYDQDAAEDKANEPVVVEKADPQKIAQEFRHHLTRQFGGIAPGWYQGLDKQGKGAITLKEWVRVCQGIGWTNSLKTLFDFFDTEGKGLVTVEAVLGPEVVQLLDTFRQCILDRYGNVMSGWDNCFNCEGSAGVHLDNFIKACDLVGFTGDMKRLFRLLDWSGNGVVSLKAFQILVDQNTGYEVTESVAVTAAVQIKREIVDPSSVVKDFRAHLNRFYANVAQAWGAALDPKGKGWLSLNEFVMGCKSVGWNDSIRTVFEALDIKKKGTVTIMDLLGPEMMKVVEEFRGRLSERYGSPTAGWTNLLNCEGGKGPHEKAFLDACQLIGFEGDGKKLFQLMDWQQSGSLTFKAFQIVMEIGVSTKAEASQADRSSYGTETLQLPPKEVAGTGSAAMGRRASLAVLSKGAAAAAHYLRGLLEKKHGSVQNGWERFFDAQLGAVDAPTFMRGCFKAGFEGDAQVLFMYLDKEETGTVACADLEETANRGAISDGPILEES